MGQVSVQGIPPVWRIDCPADLSPMYPVYSVTYVTGSDLGRLQPRIPALP